jgi:hypothetical protein
MPQLPSPVGEDINVVLVGALNPAIFQPEWFLRQKLLSEAEVRESRVQIISPQVSDLAFLEFGIQVLQNRLTLRTTDVSKAPKINDLIVGILLKLPHTPISAAGINHAVHIPTEGEKNWHKIGDSLLPKEPVWMGLYEKPGLLSISVQSPRGGDFPGFINLTVQPSNLVRYGVLVASNFEFKPSDEVGSTETVIEFIQTNWDTATKEATRAAEFIFRKILWES